MVYSGPQLSAYTKLAVVELDTQQHNGNNIVAGVTSDQLQVAVLTHYSNTLMEIKRFIDSSKTMDQPYGSINIPISSPKIIVATTDSVDSELYVDGTRYVDRTNW